MTRPNKPTNDDINNYHQGSDVDSSTLAQHHSLGIQPGQAAPGDHIHDGRTSKKLSDSGWLTPVFQNSWVNYGSVFAPARYRKVNGVVFLSGLVASGTLATIFTLPVGYRPLYTIILNTHAGGGQVRIDIANSGTVSPTAYYASGSNSYVSLENITFLAEL